MLRMEKDHADQMVAHSLQEDPNECCGILTGSDDVVSRVHRITNTAKSPFRYMMDPQEQLNVTSGGRKSVINIFNRTLERGMGSMDVMKDISLHTDGTGQLTNASSAAPAIYTSWSR